MGCYSRLANEKLSSSSKLENSFILWDIFFTYPYIFYKCSCLFVLFTRRSNSNESTTYANFFLIYFETPFTSLPKKFFL